MSNLPPCPDRLRACGDFVVRGRAVADVGCDHGQLAVWLAHTDRASRVVAIDRAPAPLSRARAHVEVWDLTHCVDLRLGDGLQPLVAADRIRTVVLAGMGARAMIRILDPARLEGLGVRRIVAQANRGAEPLGPHLERLGFALHDRHDGPPARWPWSVLAWHRS